MVKRTRVHQQNNALFSAAVAETKLDPENRQARNKTSMITDECWNALEEGKIFLECFPLGSISDFKRTVVVVVEGEVVV